MICVRNTRRYVFESIELFVFKLGNIVKSDLDCHLSAEAPGWRIGIFE